ncbi:MAG: aminodeoxychorismate/anthranilate synthase component II [Saccharospirillaceae bacterium]|nr:aminodeoxychorismate/anthranilate synthase component II [Pseudomonadales bacterium]NRB78108.1 aminodeoxychorismate/anthranilate synthase component II [Saccharospirillaceae bacterium]
MKVLIIDNYDSFTFNLYQFIGEILKSQISQKNILSFEVIVKRNDEITLDEIKKLDIDRIIISPGPGNPEDEAYFGVCAQVIKELGPKIPTLGVCLGMQGIVHVFGGKVVKAKLPMHGKTSPITHNNKGVFLGFPQGLEIMRYHSLVAQNESFPDCLDVTAYVSDDEPDFNTDDISTKQIMGVQHKDYPIYGIQFHPESFASEGGKDMIENFLLQK